MDQFELENVVEKLKDNSNRIREAVNCLSEDIKKIQDGDGSSSYWNGKNAYDCIKTAMLQLDYNKNLLKELEKNINYISSIAK